MVDTIERLDMLASYAQSHYTLRAMRIETLVRIQNTHWAAFTDIP
jgi:hypothetical protein